MANKKLPVSVLLLVNSLGLGGTEKAVEIFASYLDKNKFNVHVGAWKTGGPREATLKQKGLKTVIFNKNENLLKSYIQEHNISVVHVHYLHIPLNVFKNTTLIFHHHFSAPLYTPEEEKRFTFLLFNSYRTRQKYHELTHQTFKPEKEIVLYSPIDFAQYDAQLKSVSDKEIRTYRKLLGITPKEYVIGRLGRADIVKWSDFFIESLPYLSLKKNSVKAILQAVPRSRKWLLRHTNYASSLVMLDNDPKERSVSLFMKTIQVYTHTSKIGESLGLTLAEAMAAGKPVVVNSTPNVDNAQVEIVDNNMTGFIVRDPKSFAMAILELKNNPSLYVRMANESKKHAKSLFDARELTKQLEILYLQKFGKEGKEKNIKLEKEKNNEYSKRCNSLFTVKMNLLDRFLVAVYAPIHLVLRLCDYIEFRYFQ